MANITSARGTINLSHTWTKEDVELLLPVLDAWSFEGEYGIQWYSDFEEKKKGWMASFEGCGANGFSYTLINDFGDWTWDAIENAGQQGNHKLTREQYEALLIRMAEKGLCIQFKFENETDDFAYSDEASLYSWMLMKWFSPATVEIPEGVKNITSRTFGGMAQEYSQRRPKEIILSDTVEKIGGKVFENWKHLSKLVIPKNVKEIGKAAFAGCGIRKWNIDPENLYFKAEGPYLLSSDGMRLLAVASGCPKAAVVPEGVRTIEACAFKGRKITSIVLPDSLRTIEKEAFSESDLVSVSLPEGVKTIKESAFWWCGKLTSVSFPQTLKKVGDYGFSGCDRLKSITVLGKDTEIAPDMFRRYKNPAEVVVRGMPGSGAEKFARENQFTFQPIVEEP